MYVRVFSMASLPAGRGPKSTMVFRSAAARCSLKGEDLGGRNSTLTVTIDHGSGEDYDDKYKNSGFHLLF